MDIWIQNKIKRKKGIIMHSIINKITVFTVLCIAVINVMAKTYELQLPSDPAEAKFIILSLEGAQDKIKKYGFPAIEASQGKIAEKTYLIDVDQNGICSNADKLLIPLNNKIKGKLNFIFNNKGNFPVLISGKKISGNIKFKTDFYQLEILAKGGVLKSLKQANGKQILLSSLGYYFDSGAFKTKGLQLADGSIKKINRSRAFLPQSITDASIWQYQTPFATIFICEYDFNKNKLISHLGPLGTGVSAKTSYICAPEILLIENRLRETGEKPNFAYAIHQKFKLPLFQDGILSAAGKNNKIKISSKGDTDCFSKLPSNIDWLVFNRKTEHFGMVFPSGWQSVTLRDARYYRWGNFLSGTMIFDGFHTSMGFVFGKNLTNKCQALYTLNHKPFVFRRLPTQLSSMEKQLDLQKNKQLQLAKNGFWNLPAKIQLSRAYSFYIAAEKAWNVFCERDALELLDEARGYFKQAIKLTNQLQKEKIKLPQLKAVDKYSKFVCGVVHNPEGSWKRQKQRLEFAKKLGIEAVHFWRLNKQKDAEKKEGEINWNMNERYHRLFQSAGIKSVGGALFALNGGGSHLPGWLRKLPFFYASPDQQKKVLPGMPGRLNYAQKVIKHDRDFSDVLAWHIGGEPFVRPMLNPQDPQISKLFYHWLELKYKNIAKLNLCWKTNYHAFTDIKVSEVVKTTGTRAGLEVKKVAFKKKTLRAAAQLYDFLKFQQFCFRGYLKYCSRLTAKLDPERPNFSSFIGMSSRPIFSLGDPLQLNETQYKVYGSDYYYGPERGRIGNGIGNITFANVFLRDLEHSAGGKPVWLMEFNQGWWRPYRLSPRGEFYSQCWTGFTRGLRGLFPLNWMPGLWGLFHSHDVPVSHGRDMIKFYAEMRAMKSLTGALHKPKSKIALFFPRATYYHRDMLAPNHAIRSFETPYNPLRALYEEISLYSGYPVDFVDAERITAGKLKQYKVLMLVNARYVPREVLKKLREFVNNGGILFISGSFAQFDEYGNAYKEFPGCGWKKTMGSELTKINSSLQIITNNNTIIADSKKCLFEEWNTIKQNKRISSVLARYKNSHKVAGASFKLGKGRIYWFGFPLGSMTDYNGELLKYINSLLQQHDINASAQVTVDSGKTNIIAILAMKDSTGADWLMLCNSDNKPQSVSIAWKAHKSGFLVIDVLNGKFYRNHNFKTSLPPHSVALLKVIKRY
jgi:Beta-galactosidase trimerisation domain/Beta-galactosidase